ncbi:hypothetical protein Mgra_00008094, partial [Meloidogyne graminicola]
LIIKIKLTKENKKEKKTLFSVNTLYHILKEWEKYIEAIEELNKGKNENLEKEDILQQQLINFESLIKLGYLRYIYMDEYCRNINIFYRGRIEYKNYLNEFCVNNVNKVLVHIKKFVSQ